MAITKRTAPPHLSMNPLLTPNDVCELLGLSRAFVYKAAKKGSLPCVRFGRAVRFDPADVSAYFARHRSFQE